MFISSRQQLRLTMQWAALKAEEQERWVVPLDAGLMGAPAKAAADPELLFDVLRSIGSSEMILDGDRAHF